MIPSSFSSFILFFEKFSQQVSTNVQIPAPSPRQTGMYVISPGAQCVTCSDFLQPSFAELVPPHLQLTPDVT